MAYPLKITASDPLELTCWTLNPERVSMPLTSTVTSVWRNAMGYRARSGHVRS
ncbi:hypothetical protein ACLK1T_06500 [Escherichia coli]